MFSDKSFSVSFERLQTLGVGANKEIMDIESSDFGPSGIDVAVASRQICVRDFVFVHSGMPSPEAVGACGKAHVTRYCTPTSARVPSQAAGTVPGTSGYPRFSHLICLWHSCRLIGGQRVVFGES